MATTRKEILVLFLILLQITKPTLSQDSGDDTTIFRLPKDLVPENYDLFLHIEPANDDFSGTVNITFHLVNESSVVEDIYFHADPKFVTITYLTVNGDTNCTYESLDNYIVKCSCGNIMEESNFLYIEYEGKYSQTDGRGLVKTSYTDNGKKQYLIESYFEPTFARRAFPCFDEPDFKATFSIKIINPVSYTMPVSNSIPQDYIINMENLTVTFQPTPKISTYLVSIFVSNFEETSFSYADDEEYTFKFLTRSGFEDLTSKVAGTHYGQIMDALSNFTGQSFQDIGDTECYQVAVPDYFSEDMGNFGLFVYKERDLLDEGDKTTVKVTQNILQAMTYKISHEWFGGEVSTTWWSDFWANEAVPMYFKYIIPNKIDEGFEFTNQFVVDVVQKAMQYDAMPFVEPLSSDESDITNEWGIENKLDKHSLLKGATLLHMINYFVSGEDQFRENLQNHLQNRTGSGTDGLNMLEDLTKADTIQDLYSAAQSWASTAGFPLLSVKIDTSTDEKETLAFSQKRFVYPTDNTTIFSDDIKWNIPVSYTTSSTKYFEMGINVYYAPNIELYVDIHKDNWVLFNIQGRFHYRVNYEEELWRRIINAFEDETERTEIHSLSRAQVIDDVFNIARIGEVDYSLAFKLADTLVYETDYYPWYSAFNAFSYLLGKMKDDDVEERLKMYILSLMENVIYIPDHELAVQENETQIDVLKNVMMIEWACKLGHSECISFATEQFANFKENQTSMTDYNLRPVILCNGIRYSENVSEDWKFLWSVFESSTSVHEQYDILQALGCAEDKETLKDYIIRLAVPIISAYFKRQDTMVVFGSVLSNSAGIEAAMSLLESSIAYIQFIFNGELDEVYYLSDMILALAEKLTTDEQLQQFQDTLSSHDVLSGYEDLRVKAETLAKVNIYWAKQYQDVIEGILPEIVVSTTRESTGTSEYTTAETTVTTDYSAITDQPTSIEPSTTTESSSEIIFVSRIIVVVVGIFTLII